MSEQTQGNRLLQAGGIAALVLGGALVFGLAVGWVPRPTTYVVQKGDSVAQIARANRVSVSDVVRWNSIEDADRIEVGQVLLLWPTSPMAQVQARAKVKSGVTTHAVKVPAAGSLVGSRAALSMPAPKACKAGPTEADLAGTDEAYVGSQGLSRDAIRKSMGGFVGNTLPCIQQDAHFPEHTLLLEITVGCNGQVSDIYVADQGDWPPSTTSCVVDTLKYAPFPAHDLPDGERFAYPLKFTR